MKLVTEDEGLRIKAIDQLDWDLGPLASDIGVTVKGSVVTLSGHVGSYKEKHAAEMAIRNIRGMRGIAQEIVVRLAEADRVSDDEIARCAIDLINKDTMLFPGLVQIKVEQGWMRLSGQVEHESLKEAVEHAVRGVKGLIGVTNHINLVQKSHH